MSNYSNQNNERKEMNCNSNGIQLYNQYSEFSPSTVILGSWNDSVTIKIHPTLSGNNNIGKSKVFDYDHNLNVILGYATVVTLYKEALEKIIPAVQSKKQGLVGVTLGGQTQNSPLHLVTLSYNVQVENSCVLSIYKNLDGSTMQAQDTISYVFNKSNIVTSFEMGNKENCIATTAESEFIAFIEALEVAAKGMLANNNHAANNANKYKADRLDRAARQILGEQKTYTGKGNGNTGGFNIQDNNIENQEAINFMNGNAEPEKISSVDNLNDFM